MLTRRRDPRLRAGRSLEHDLETLVLAVGILAVILAICVVAAIWPEAL